MVVDGCKLDSNTQKTGNTRRGDVFLKQKILNLNPEGVMFF